MPKKIISTWNAGKRILYFFIGSFSMAVFHAIGTGFFEFIAGAYLFLWFYMVLQRIQNVVFLFDAEKIRGFSGNFSISRGMLKRISSLNLMNHAVLLSIVAIMTMRPFFWGGLFIFSSQSIKSFLSVKKAYQEADIIKLKKNV